MTHRTRVWKNVWGGWSARCRTCGWVWGAERRDLSWRQAFSDAVWHTRLWATPTPHGWDATEAPF